MTSNIKTNMRTEWLPEVKGEKETHPRVLRAAGATAGVDRTILGPDCGASSVILYMCEHSENGQSISVKFVVCSFSKEKESGKTRADRASLVVFLCIHPTASST